MTKDARFEDGGETPLRLLAQTPEDVPIVSALIQDAVFPSGEMKWDRRTRQFAILLNRFRWEDRVSAEREARPYERVRSVLSINDVRRAASQGIDREDRDSVMSILSIAFTPGEDGTGTFLLTLAGDGAIRIEVECIDILLRDVTQPYRAPSGKVPDHGA